MIVVTAQGEGGEFADVKCPTEAPMASGGGGAGDGKGAVLEISAPTTDGKLSGAGQQPNGWRVKASSGSYTAYVICTGSGESAEAEKEAALLKEAAEK